MSSAHQHTTAPSQAPLERILRYASLALACWSVSSCSCSNKRAGTEAALMISEVRGELQPIQSVSPGKPTSSQRAYLEYYRIRSDVDSYRFGTFQSNGATLAACLLRCGRQNRGTVIIVHGYLDHTGRVANLINRFTAEGYCVAVYDQPGHGLSGGRRVSVRDFAVYQSGFSEFFRLVRSQLPPPYHVVAHSFGGTVVAEHLLTNEQASLRRVVLIAPVVRDALPRPMQFLGRAVSPLIDYVPRVALGSSSDPEYEERVKFDPLRFRCVSTRWTKALHQWRLRMDESPPSPRSPLIVNAEIDKVVDNAYGERWMKRAFPGARFATVRGGRHHLFNEIRPIRERALNLICAELRR